MPRQNNFVKLMMIVLILGLLTTGCWNRRELDTLAIVLATAFDKAQDPDRVLLTVQIVVPEAFGPEGTGGVGHINLTSTGNTVFEANRNHVAKLDRRLFYPFNEVIFFSEEVAQEGVGPFLDFFIRDHEPRTSVPLLITEGRAADYLNVAAGIERLPARYIVEIMERQAAALGKVPHVELEDFARALHSSTREPVASIMELVGEDDDKELFLKETAVFKKDKMVGRLDRHEGRGYLWINDDINSGVIIVKSPIEGDPTEHISLEISNSRTKITPSITDDNIHIKIQVSMESSLDEQMSPHDLTTPEAWSSLESQQATVIQNEIMAAVKKAQELNADIFGFGEAVHRKYPRVFKDIEEEWDKYFSTLEVSTEIKAKVRRTMMLTKPIQRN